MSSPARGWLQQMPVVGSYATLFSLAGFTTHERKAVVSVRWSFLLRSLCVNIHKPAMLNQLLSLCGADAALMAMQIGRTQATIAICGL